MHIRPCETCLFDHILSSLVLRVGSYENRLVRHRPSPQFVQHNGAERLAGKPERDGRCRTQVAMLPGDLGRCCSRIIDREMTTTRVQQYEIGIVE